MNLREHYNFLLEIAKAIHTLTVSAKAKAKFDARMKKFKKMFLDWSAAIVQARKDADADPRLRDPQAELSKEGYIWDTPEGLWRFKDCPPNPTAWLWNRAISPEQRELTLDEILTCDYFRLAAIHDGALQGQRHIYFQCTEGDVWTDDTGASGPIPTEARFWWKEISEWGQDKETWFPGLRAQIENALSDVEADIRRVCWLWRLLQQFLLLFTPKPEYTGEKETDFTGGSIESPKTISERTTETYTRKRKRKSKTVKFAAITAHLEEKPTDNSFQVGKATGIDPSDVRRIWGPIKKALKESKRGKFVGKKHKGKTESVDESATCQICQAPLSRPFECSICEDIIKGECKICHFTNEHPDDALP